MEKAALSSEGSWHILSFAKKYDQLKAFNPWVRVLEPLLSEDGMTVRFRFLEGITLAEKLGSQIRNGKAPLEEIRAAMKMVFDVDKDQTMPFTVTPEFTEVFGEIPDIDDISYKVSNIDGLFENLMDRLGMRDFIAWITSGYLISRFRPILYSTAIWLTSIINTRDCFNTPDWRISLRNFPYPGRPRPCMLPWRKPSSPMCTGMAARDIWPGTARRLQALVN